MKNKRVLAIALILLAMFSFYSVLNMEVSIQQGINFEVSAVKMPLYMKIIDFWSRSNHYKLLVEKIIMECKTDREKLEALYNWTSENIRRIPDGFPVVDDHVDSIIIRGYGTNDQSADVFTTLAVFAGFNAGMYAIKMYPEKHAHVISLVELDDTLVLFDTYFSFYFFNKYGEIASLDEIREDIDLVKKTAGDFKFRGKFDYFRLYQNLKPVDRLGWTKADLQMPLKRLIYIIGRMLHLAVPSRVFYGERLSYG